MFAYSPEKDSANPIDEYSMLLDLTVTNLSQILCIRLVPTFAVSVGRDSGSDCGNGNSGEF